MAKAKDKKVILDTSGDLLREGIKANPTMIKYWLTSSKNSVDI